MMDNSPVTGKPHGRAERLVERTIFASRWLLAPFYLGLVVSLVVLLIKFGQKIVKLVTYSLFSSGSDVIPVVLSLIDLSLIANLMLIVMFSGLRELRIALRTRRSKIQASLDGSCRLWGSQD
jgi:uncharacterized protein (TIGR00645 family)